MSDPKSATAIFPLSQVVSNVVEIKIFQATELLVYEAAVAMLTVETTEAFRERLHIYHEISMAITR
ncbi:hypothetical protein [Phaffia rhodozyma]|uniref:Uncharacterized protein n=1 Tax=Phaffia rhodozyma TaxID=264483 RepID=A0A0F7SQ25_PHARH|nr:hypothetical protein [Phaffia rhodozyma]